MTQLALWFETHADALIQAAVDELSTDETQKSQVTETVVEFFNSLQQVVHSGDSEPLNRVLEHWVSLRSAPADSELSSLVPVLTGIRQANNALVYQSLEPGEAIEFLAALDSIYNPAMGYLSKLEVDAVLKDMRGEIAEAREQLRRLDKSKTDFIAVAAHELRTPITLIEGYSNMLATSVPGMREDALAGQLVEGITGGVHRLREIIRDMIDVSLISLDMLELHHGPAFLHQLLDSLERTCRPAIAERNLQLIIERDTIPRKPTYADSERLLQVFEKIVYNAIKYTPDGGRIVISGRELTGFADVTVVDNGIGISPTDLPRIFEMFSSLGDSALHSSSKIKFRGGGPGLGLFISKGILEAHGGNIWAESPGFDEHLCPGSTFHLLIPMRTAPLDDKIQDIFNEA